MSAPLALADLLALEPFRRCRPEVLCGQHLLDRPVRWIHTSELAEAATLLKGEELLLTTALGLAGRGTPGIRAYVAALGERHAALALELGWTFSSVPSDLLEAAREHDVPVIALHDVVPFVELTEAGQEAILNRRLLARGPAPDDEAARRHRLVEDLELGRVRAADLQHRLSEVGIAHAGNAYSAVVIRGFRPGFATAVEQIFVKDRRHGTLTTSQSGDVVALLPTEPTMQLGADLLGLVDEFSRSRGEATSSRVAITEPATLLDAATRLPDARHALSLAAALGMTDRVLAAPLISARMVLNRLAGDALAARLVDDELGGLIAYDHRHHTSLLETLHVYLTHGSNMQVTAKTLGCSRQSLYRRKESIVRLIGDIDRPDRHANLVVAVELHALRQRFVGVVGDRNARAAKR